MWYTVVSWYTEVSWYTVVSCGKLWSRLTWVRASRQLKIPRPRVTRHDAGVYLGTVPVYCTVQGVLCTVRWTRSKLWGINKKTAARCYSAPECPWNCSNITRDRRLYNSISCNCFCVDPHLKLTDHSSDTRLSSGLQFWNMNILLWKRHNHVVPHEYKLKLHPCKMFIKPGLMSGEPEQTRLYHSVQWSVVNTGVSCRRNYHDH